MNAGVVFTEKYLKMMFKQLRDATPEQVQAELEHCRRENRKTVRVSRHFTDFFQSESYTTPNGYAMQYFKHVRPSRKLILFLHGGAFIYQPVFFHWRFTHDLSLRTHADLMIPIYPKSPEYNCEYCVTALLDFYHNVVERQDYDEIHFVGDSAGACLCLVVAQEAAKNGWRQPKTTLLLSPCVDLSHSRELEMRALQPLDPMLQLDRVIMLNAIWQDNLPVRHPWVSPVFGDFSGINNLSVYFGTNEILKPDALFLKETYENAEKTGRFIEVEGMFHTFPLFPIPQGFAAVKDICRQIK